MRKDKCATGCGGNCVDKPVEAHDGDVPCFHFEGHRPLVHGLLRQVSAHVDLKMLKRADGLVDGESVIDLFHYVDMDWGKQYETLCVCGHKIVKRFFVTCPHIGHNVVIGSCCIKRWMPEMVKRLAAVDAQLFDRRELFMQLPHLHCARCLQKRSLGARALHEHCVPGALKQMLAVTKQTPFVKSVTKQFERRGHLTPRQTEALNDGRWWPAAQRISLQKSLCDLKQ